VGSGVRLVEVDSVEGLVEEGLGDEEGSVVDSGVVLDVIFRIKICMLITMDLTRQQERMDLVEVVV